MQKACIFARGGSKGVKDKNIRQVAGKPLIAHTIETALKAPSIDGVLVSTDSEAIAQTAKQYGAETLMRLPELAEDATPEILAWRHAIEEAALGELFISLPATSPLRNIEDIEAGISRYKQGNCDIVFGVSPSHRSPYLNMAKANADGHLQIVIPTDATRRQDVPELFDITTCVYVGSPNYVQHCESLMQGKVGYVEIPPERALDIDTPFDLHLADLLLSNPMETKNG